MKKILFSLFIAIIITYGMNGQSFSGTYTFANVTTSSGTTDPTPVPTATGLTFGSFSAVNVATNSDAAARFAFASWPTGATNGSNTFTGNIDLTKYYQVTITPAANYSIDLDSIRIGFRRSGTGVRQFAVRSSLDNYGSNLPASIATTNSNLQVVATDIIQVTDAATTYQSGSRITLGGNFDDITSSITIRIYGFNAEGTAGNFSLNDIVFRGVARPSNNNCLNATTINGAGGAGTPTGTAITATTVGATESMAATCGGDADDDVWFKFTTDNDGSAGTEDATITISAPSINPVIQAYTGSCGSLTPIPLACVNATSLPLTGLTGNQTIYIRVYDFASGFTGGGVDDRASGAFSIAVEGTALPITLKSLTATPKNKTTLLNFTTATETNNAYFNIERSADGVKFENIGRVQGNGTTAQEHNYSFTDETPLAGVNYYRLQQVDFDGQSSYSKVVSVRFGKSGQVYTVYPNPATDVLKVEATEAAEGVLNIEIYNQAGALVKQLQYDAETTLNEVPVADLPAGNYIVKMMSGAEVTVEKFSKQ